MKPLTFCTAVKGLLVLAMVLQLTSRASDQAPVQAGSGNAFLSAYMLAMQNDPIANPISLWLERGKDLWNASERSASCQQCHGALEKNNAVANHFPKWSASLKKLINIEDQILACSQKTTRPYTDLEDANVLSLSAVLHQQSRGLPNYIPAESLHQSEGQQQLDAGAAIFTKRMGRMNLACTHCHDQQVGKRMQSDVISPAHPTGFPIFKMNWQSMGSIDRRIRACYSGVQAQIPPPGSTELRQLELFLKMRSQGMRVDGPSLRR